MNNKKEKEMTIGKNYTVVDICGMVSFEAKYLGIGHKRSSYDGRKFFKDYGPENQFYVFEQEIGYKYIAAKPVFSGLEFSHFVAVRYGDSLPHLFVDFKQPLFSLEDDHYIIPDSFDLNYSKDKKNSGGHFFES